MSMKKLVWGFSSSYGIEETVLRKSKNIGELEDAQVLLARLDDNELIKLLEIEPSDIKEGIYFRIK